MRQHFSLITIFTLLYFKCCMLICIYIYFVSQVFIWFGFIITSYGIALVLELLFESPIINLGKIVFYERESYKKKKKAKSVANEDISAGDWKNGPIPQLVNGYAKCNGAFDYQAEIMNKSKCETFDKTGNQNGDFICHL